MKKGDIDQMKQEQTHPKVSTGEKSRLKEKHYLYYI
jgi:hypothetical protein